MKKEITKETYVKPESEIINIEVEQPILDASAPNFIGGDDNYWG